MNELLTRKNLAVDIYEVELDSNAAVDIVNMIDPNNNITLDGEKAAAFLQMVDEFLAGDDCKRSQINAGTAMLIGAGITTIGFATFILGKKMWAKYKTKKSGVTERG